MLFLDELDELEEAAKPEEEPDESGAAVVEDEQPQVEEEGDASPLTLEKHRGDASLSLQGARSAQAGLIREYTKPAFQDRLHLLASVFEPDSDEWAAGRAELASEAEVRVAKASGFDGSASGAALMKAALIAYASGDPETAHRDEIIRWLLDPVLQKTEPLPKGPARLTIFSTARIYSSDQSHICVVQVHINDTIRCLKENIYLHTRKPWLVQKLYVGETELFDQVLLSSLMRVGTTTDFRLEYREPEIMDWLGRLKKEGVAAMEGAPKALLADPEFMRPAVQLRAKVLVMAADSLRADRNFILQLAAHCGQALRYAAPELASDREVVLAAVCQDPWVLELADETLKADRQVVMEAVRRDSWALQFAVPELRYEEELVLMATRKDPSIILQVLPELQQERKVVLQCIQQDWRLLESLGPEVQRDRDVVLAAVRQSGWALQFVPPELLADRQVALEALRNTGDALRFVDPELYSDREVLLTAVTQSGTALGLASPDVQDLEMALAAVKNDRRSLVFVARHLIKDVAAHFGLDYVPAWVQRERTEEKRPSGASEEVPRASNAQLAPHFAVLELSPTASKAEIRRKYHQLVLQYHPDKFVGDAEVGKQMFQKVQEAYEALHTALGL